MDKSSFSRAFLSLSPIVELRESWSHEVRVLSCFIPFLFISAAWSGEGNFATILLSSSDPRRLLHWPPSWREGLLHHLVFFIPK